MANSYLNRIKLKELIILLISNSEHNMELPEIMNRLFIIDSQAKANLMKALKDNFITDKEIEKRAKEAYEYVKETSIKYNKINQRIIRGLK